MSKLPLNDAYRENAIKILCDMYAPASYPLFVKSFPAASEDESGEKFKDFFELIQTILAMRGKGSDIAERKEVAATIRPKLKEFGLPEDIALKLEARNNHDSLNSII
jgi:hypothetical protein